MKTFKDLDFKKHPSQPMFETHAKMSFENNYGISVCTGHSAYSSDSHPYEVAVLYKNGITYHSGITDDVIGYQTKGDVENLMKRIQELK